VTDGFSPTVRQVPERLADADRIAVAGLIEAVTGADGAGPVSEDGRLAVEHGRAGARHLVARDGAESVIGYLYLGPAEDGDDRIAELCVAPAFRRRGVGSALISQAIEETGGTLRAWAHGDLPGAKALAARFDFVAVRDLRLLELEIGPGSEWARRSADSGARQAGGPATSGRIRPFQPGQDDAAWLALNAAAFAHHPEQGRWTERDLAERMAEPWFDPAGFLLFERDGRLVGFHWTKVHPAGEYGPGPVGEIYVLGVHPDAAGGGLGRLLAEAGLSHLAQLGLRSVVLYVDGDNDPALRLYASIGFRTRSVDALYERPRSR
jgi:mycothiol synthase